MPRAGTTTPAQDAFDQGPTFICTATDGAGNATTGTTSTTTPVPADASSSGTSGSSAAGVSDIELPATLDDGSQADLGAATVSADGSFVFSDDVGCAAGTQSL